MAERRKKLTRNNKCSHLLASTLVVLYAALMVGHSADRSNRKVKIFGVASKDKWTMLRSSPYGYNYMVDYHDED